MPALAPWLRGQLEENRQAGRYRAPVTTMRQAGGWIERDGKRLLSFSCNDYFGLSQHPDVIAAARTATGGAGAGASRLVTGSHACYSELEAALAQYKGCEAATVFGSGYLANIGTISALMGKDDLILADKLTHACMIDGAKLSGATFKRFAHNDVVHLQALLEKHRADYRHCLIVTETVFSMDGDCAPLDELAAVAKAHDAWLMSDDAHGLGVVDGANPADIKMGTLSKSLGAYGGYVCGSGELIEYLHNAARSMIFTTGLPPSVLAGACKALEILATDAALRCKPLANAQAFTTLLGLPLAQSAIVPLIIGESGDALAASDILAKAGFWVQAIRPPTVPPGTARLRFAFSAQHQQEDIERLADEVKKHGWPENTHP